MAAAAGQTAAYCKELGMSELLFVVALLTMIQDGKSRGTATGFFYTQQEVVYLVTNLHVVIDESKGLKPESLKVRLHTDPKDLTRNTDRIIPLYKNGTPTWHVHPDYPTVPIDIAVIELDPGDATKDTFFTSLTPQNFLPPDVAISPGEDVLMVGFPRGLSDQLHNLPLVRSALIATPYGVNFQGQPMFLVDANLHLGMSGSPVMTKPRTREKRPDGEAGGPNASALHLLGIYSATISFGKEALGLGQVWYADLIEQIVTSFAKPIMGQSETNPPEHAPAEPPLQETR